MASPSDQPAQNELKYPDRQSLPGSAQRNVPVLVEALLPLLQPLLREHEGEPTSQLERAPHVPFAPVRVLEIAAGHGGLMLALRSAVLSQQQQQQGSIEGQGQALLKPRQVQWVCTEADDALVQSIRSNISQEGAQTVKAAEEIAVVRLEIDNKVDWSALTAAEKAYRAAPAPASVSHSAHSTFDLVHIANLLHIVPFETVRTLFSHLSHVLSTRTQARVCIYGAFNEEGKFTSEGNEKFDEDLRSRNSLYGLRDLQGDILPLAEEHGMQLEQVMRLARGNLMLILRHR